MNLFVYFLFRMVSWCLGAVPLSFAIKVGRAVGACAWLVCRPYRRLVERNLEIAFGDKKTRSERFRLGAESFARLAGNVAAGMHLSRLPVDAIVRFVECEGLDHVRRQIAQGRGMIMVIGHMGNWELLSRVFPAVLGCKCGTIFQKLSNPWMDAAVRRERSKEGLLLFERKEGFHAALSLLREGGVVGVLADQHAGDPGLWCSFFGKLASTSPLPAMMSARTGAVLMACGMETLPSGRWRLVIGAPFGGDDSGLEAMTLAANESIEGQIRRSPADWLWAHNRWKTPYPDFLLANSKRGCVGRGLTQRFKLLVRSPNWLGDAVMAVPAVRSMKLARPDLELTVSVPAKLVEFWRAVSEVDRVIEIAADESPISVANRLRSFQFDAAVVLPNSFRTGLEVWLAGIPRRVGFPGHGREWFLNQVFRKRLNVPPEAFQAPEGVGSDTHQIRHYMRLAVYAGGRDLALSEWFPAGRVRVMTSPADGAPCADSRLRLAVCPGAEFGPAKRWFPERFAAAMHAISERHSCEWQMVGVQKDNPVGEQIEKWLSENSQAGNQGGTVRLKNWMGKTSMGELIDLLRGCDALLTNDTGTMHLAVMLGVPVVSVFGSTDPAATGPVGPNHRVLQHKVPCGPCFLRECPKDFACMEKVTVQEVVEAVDGTLKGLLSSKKVLPADGSDLMLSSL